MYLSAADKAMLSRIRDALNSLRTIYVDMTLTQAVLLLNVAARPGLSQAEITHLTGLSEASVSRVINILGSAGNRGTGPFNLLETRPHRDDARIKEVFLTPTGTAVIAGVLRDFVGVSYDRPPKE